MNVLFVSENDLCRGPMARALAQKQARDMEVPIAGFDSAGLDVVRPIAVTPDFIEFMRQQDLNVAKHLSKPLTGAPIRWADLILCMTRDIAARARTLVGPSRAGIVLVLNEAVRLAHKPAEKDIGHPAEPTRAALLVIFSRVKAATGRLVRHIGYGQTHPTDFGAEEIEAEPAGRLDDPNVRRFLGRYVVEFIERAFEPLTTADLLAALDVMGRPISVIDLEDLIACDLRGEVVQTDDGIWAIAEGASRDRARARSARVEAQRRREEEEARERARRDYEAKMRARRGSGAGAGFGTRGRGAAGSGDTRSSGGGPGSGSSRGRTRRVPVEQITEAEALQVLSITIETPRGEALKAYRRLLMRFHPDKFQDDSEFRDMAEKKTIRINLAWSLLKDILPAEE